MNYDNNKVFLNLNHLKSFCFLILLFFFISTPKLTFADPVLDDPALGADTSRLVNAKKEETVKIIKNDKPIIIRRGKILEISLGEIIEPIQVRIHSSLGRLVKNFRDVTQDLNYNTQELLPGVYIIVIKRQAEREIRKFILTD